MKKIFLLILCSFFLIQNEVLAQDELNAFKYIIIPKKYDFLKKENQYRLNTITKHLFDNEGFETVIKGGDYPQDLLNNPCLGALVELVNESSMLTTKLKLEFRNCHEKVVYTTEIGKSKEKAYEKTYPEALEKTFQSVKQLSYQFDPDKVINRGTAIAQQSSAQPTTNDQVSNAVTTSASTNSSDKQVTSKQDDQVTGVAAATTTAVAVPVAATSSESKESDQKEISVSEKTEVAAVQEASDDLSGYARSYKNENISFFLIEQGGQLVAYVNETNNDNYKKGEKIGTFEKTSLPNVFRVNWKKRDNNVESTTAYFDDKGNLRVDIKRNGKLEVLTFTEDN